LSSHPGDARAAAEEEDLVVSRHLMEPDPDAPLPSLRYMLWVCAFVLGAVVTALQLAS
jgi:hypothetical protein